MVDLGGSRFWRRRLDDDSVDRLSRHYSVALITILVLVSYGKQLIGQPIVCWYPAEFSESHREYGDSVCWTSVLYSVGSQHFISYHSRESITDHWIRLLFPILWIIQAVCCSTPGNVWKFFYRRSRIDLDSVVDILRVRQENQNEKLQKSAIRGIADQIERFLAYQRCGNRFNCFGKMCSINTIRKYHLVIGYLMIKLLYLLNAVEHLNAMMKATEYGSDSSDSRPPDPDFWRTNSPDEGSGLNWDKFSRVALCEFEMRHQSRVHNYGVQCSLPINVFHGYASMCLWVWFLVLTIVTFFSLVQWTFRILYWPGHTKYVCEQIWTMERHLASRTPARELTRFTKDHLGRDGMLVIHIIGMNVSHVVAGDVIWELWKNWIEEKKPNNPIRKQLYNPYSKTMRYRVADGAAGAAATAVGATEAAATTTPGDAGNPNPIRKYLYNP